MAKKYTKKRQASVKQNLRTKKNKRTKIKRRITRRSKNMKGGFFKLGGGSANNDVQNVQNVMIENLCTSTRSGGSLEETDKVASTNVKNLCNFRNTNIQNSPTNTLSGGNSSKPGFIGKAFSLITAPIRLAFSIIGSITGFSAESKTPLNNALAVPVKPVINTVRTNQMTQMN